MQIAELRRLLSSPTVSLYVGQDHQCFVVHKNLLCHVVPFFSKAFDSGFTESTTSEMLLPDEDPQASSLFLVWLYKGLLPLVDASQIKEYPIDDYVRLYIMAEKCCLRALQKVAVNLIYKYFLLPVEETRHALARIALDVYSQPNSSKIRFFVVRHSLIYACKSDETARLNAILEGNEEFAVDFGKEACKMLRNMDSSIAAAAIEHFYT